MKKWLGVIWNIFYGGGLTKEEYRHIIPYYSKQNWRIWRVITVLIAVVFTVLFGVSFFSKTAESYRYIYLGMACYAIFTSVIFVFVLNENSTGWLRFFIYASCAMVFSMGILLGIETPNEQSVAFMVMLFVVPLVIVDRPYRLIIMNAVASIAFNVSVIMVKSPEVWQSELFNVIVYYLLSCVLVTFILRNSFSRYLETYKTEQRIYVDALTGLGSELAYLKDSEELNNLIKNRKCGEFAVVMMDLNNVKTTNDTYGHVFGCAMIVEAAQYIKFLFQDSKTYHVGGDEYIAILQGADYENREELIRRFDEKMEDYYFTKEDIELRIVVARGIAEFVPQTDKSFKKVLRKADSLMYENKRYVKTLYNLPPR